jgi:16S rRNA (cytosine1402-N4)-methyltransferase
MNFEGTGHKPVLLKELVDALKPKQNEIYFDATFGNGGYSSKLLETTDCKIIAIDQDPFVQTKAQEFKKKYGERFNFFEEKFSGIQNVMERIKEKEINGFIFDIGISSMQLDNPNRGFSFQSEGSLDMRMDSKGKTAAELIENIKEDELADIIYHYGDERNSRKIASKIVEFRKNSKINNTLELATIVKGCFPSKYYKKHPATKTFQAIRIYLNNEIEELCAGLNNASRYLIKGGRLCIVSFHSIEDRLIKNFFQFGKNDSGSARNLFDQYKNKVFTPDDEEINENPRSRSAKLRFAIRNEIEFSSINLTELGFESV